MAAPPLSPKSAKNGPYVSQFTPLPGMNNYLLIAKIRAASASVSWFASVPFLMLSRRRKDDPE
jgi:hypothetical protein